MKKYIFLMLVSCIYLSNTSIAQVKSLQVVQEEQIDLAPGKVLIDAEDNIVGHEKNLKRAGQFIGTYQSQLSVEGWPEVTIDRYLNLIVDKKNKRLITYGYPPSNDVASQEVNLAIYDSAGQLLFQKENVLSSFKIPIRISNSGAIYIGGWNTQLEQVVHKYDKNGNLEWEVKLPFQLMVSELELSESNLTLVVLQHGISTGIKKFPDAKSALVHLDKTGKVKNTWKSNSNFSMLRYLNDTSIIISNGHNLILKEISALDSDRDNLYTTDKMSKIKCVPGKNSLVVLTKENKLYHFQLLNKKLVKQKEFDLNDINTASVDVIFINVERENMIEVLTKNAKYYLQ